MGVAQALFLRGDAHGIYLNINQKLINLILYVAADIVNFLEFTRNFFLGYSSSFDHPAGNFGVSADVY